VSRYQKGKTNLDFTEARDSEWQWHQPGQMQVCTSLQTDNHASTPSCRPTNSVKALKAINRYLLLAYHSSKPAAAGLLLWAHDGIYRRMDRWTDRQMDGHRTVL